MRNIFDQYDQPENKLTHALVTTLEHDRACLRPFLEWLGLSGVPPVGTLRLTEQHVPGTPLADVEETEGRGLPDACIFNDDGWAVLFECKVQARVDPGQVRRHRDTAVRHGFDSPHLFVIAVDEAPDGLCRDAAAITWRDLYRWFSRRAADSFWAGEFVRYMQIFERKMLAQDYDIRGTITVFDGLRFTEDNPYTYREGKRLLRLLGDELQARGDLHQVGVDPAGSRRPAITGKGLDNVWDFLPLACARDAEQFTSYPHLTIALHHSQAKATVTVPNQVKGGFRRKLRDQGVEGFRELLADLEQRARPVIERSRGAKPMAYLLQRHYKGRRTSQIDARLEADLRTAVPDNDGPVKYQPQWLAALYDVLVHKKSNLQLSVEVRFRYDCPVVRSPQAVDLFADSCKALSPLISFVLQDE